MYKKRTPFSETSSTAYHPTVLLKIYIYSYLNRVRSSRRLEKECHLLKGKTKVSAEYSLVFLAYNLRRAVNLLDFSVLLQRVKHFFSRKPALLFEFSAIFTPKPSQL